MAIGADVSKATSTVDLLDEKIREARGVVKDLSRVLKEARETAEMLETKAADAARATIDPIVERVVGEQMAALGKATREAMDEAVEKVGKEFESLANIMLYGNAQGRGESLVELTQRLKEEQS